MLGTGMTTRRSQSGFLFFLATIAGCAIASPPLKDIPQIVATPQTGQTTITTQPVAPVGEIQPVYVSIANGSDMPKSVVPSQIFALDSAGNRIGPIPAGEAARQAGGAGELKAALESGAASGFIGSAVGAGLGAVAGSLIHSGATGAALGSVVGAGEGGLHGVVAGSDKADKQAQTQMTALALQPADVRQNFTVNGYVFFPKGDYRQIQLVLVDDESGNTEIVNRPWR
jgi:hypothetical protein